MTEDKMDLKSASEQASPVAQFTASQSVRDTIAMLILSSDIEADVKLQREDGEEFELTGVFSETDDGFILYVE